MTDKQRFWLRINLVAIAVILVAVFTLTGDPDGRDTRKDDEAFQREIDANLQHQADYARTQEATQGR